ncbi:hypothetical protein NUW58_g6467 [Xylaria curta]|uniref:Uncharacterized protein n=1 Tax=Xylaria curta TaxID=42375 RepID=A0ACC1NSM0_9PEZI|nr:hypothetical protein NUW58_g6467 [Xylaria curta]
MRLSRLSLSRSFLMLQTQFWNTYTGLESKGQLLPKDQWTIHGLWPDFCNGSYTQYCDLKRQYDPFPSPNTTTGKPDGTPVKPWKGVPISDYIKRFRKYDLLAYMNKYWTGLNQEAGFSGRTSTASTRHASATSTRSATGQNTGSTRR